MAIVGGLSIDTGAVEDCRSQDKNLIIKRPVDRGGVSEKGEITAETSTSASTSVVLNNGNEIHSATIGFWDENSSPGIALLIGFAGTPYNDPGTAGTREYLPLNSERTYVFDDDMPATGINFRTVAASTDDAHRITWGVIYK